MFLNPKNIILDVKFPPVFFGINFATTLYGFFLCQEVFYHVFGKPDTANSYECPHYGIGYATADHPLGPWTKSEHNPILQSPGTLQGCGHHAIFKDKRHRYRVVFHAHHAPGQISPRIMHLTRLKFIPQKNTADRLIFLPDYFTPQLTRD